MNRLKRIFDYFWLFFFPFVTLCVNLSCIGWVCVYYGLKEMPEGITEKHIFASFVSLLIGLGVLLTYYTISHCIYMYKTYFKKRKDIK